MRRYTRADLVFTLCASGTSALRKFPGSHGVGLQKDTPKLFLPDTSRWLISRRVHVAKELRIQLACSDMARPDTPGTDSRGRLGGGGIIGAARVSRIGDRSPSRLRDRAAPPPLRRSRGRWPAWSPGREVQLEQARRIDPPRGPRATKYFLTAVPRVALSSSSERVGPEQTLCGTVMPKDPGLEVHARSILRPSQDVLGRAPRTSWRPALRLTPCAE